MKKQSDKLQINKKLLETENIPKELAKASLISINSLVI
jgi:hypothetical protein